jgi:hypothetical protein
MRSATSGRPSQLPTREQFNRQMRHHQEALVAFFQYLVRFLAAQRCAYEAFDSAGVPTRDAKHRGAGWLPGLADIGSSNRLGWYEGFRLLLAVSPVGAITGANQGRRQQPRPGDKWHLEDYNQAHAENAFSKFKRIFGGTLRAKRDEAQEREAALACQLLNRMLELSRPQSYPVS